MVAELRGAHPELNIAALGGPKLAAAGAQLLYDLTASSVVGIVEVLKHYGFFRQLFDETVRWIAQHRPRAVCFVDYPGFNLRIAKALREQGISCKGGGSTRTLYYISPQIWAWKAKRRFSMARDLDAMAVIFPFETGCYQDTALPVEFVGHPFVAGDYVAPVRHDPAGPVLLLPGSRRQAVARIFPVLLAGYEAYRRSVPAGQPARSALVLYPSEGILTTLRAARPPADLELRRVSGSGSPTEPIGVAAVLTSSGTMSMHCALAGIPGAITYRAASLTYVLGRLLVKVPYLGIANLLLHEPMYPEYIQNAATPAALAAELRTCLSAPARHERTKLQANRLRQLLGVPGSRSAAEWVLRQLSPGRAK
jgi:lipid-A-disaccharide synthase